MSRYPFPLRCLRLLAGMALTIFSLAAPAFGEMGDVTQSLALPVAPRNFFWAVSEQTGNHHLLGTGGQVRVVNSLGQVQRQGTLNATEGPSVVAAGGDIARGGGMAVGGMDDNWVLFDGGQTITRWVLVERVAGGGNWTLSLSETKSIAGFLQAGDDAKGFAMRDGVAWITVFNSGRIRLLQVSLGAPSLIKSIELVGGTGGNGALDRLFNIFNSNSSVESVSAQNSFAMEQQDGLQLFQMLAPAAAGPLSNYFIYAVQADGAHPQLIGRFLAPAVSLAPEWCGDKGGVWLRTNNTGTVTRYNIEPAPLPGLDRVSFNQRGVFWTQAHATTQVISLHADWAESAPGRAMVSSGINVRGLEVNPSGEVEVKWNPYDYRPGYTSPATTRSIRVRLMNGDNQISPMIYEVLPLGVYRDALPPASGSIWSRSNTGDVAKYMAQGIFPQPPLEGKVTFPAFFPFVGGKSYGFSDLQASLDGEYLSHGRGMVGVTGTGRLLLGSGFLGVTIGGGAASEFLLSNTLQGQLTYPAGTVKLNVFGGVKDEAGILDVFPQVAPLRSPPLIGRVLDFINERAKIAAETSANLSGTLYIESAAPPGYGFAFSGDIEGGMGLAASSAVQVIGMPVELSAFASANAQSGFSFNPFEMKPLTLTVRAGGRLVLYYVVRQLEAVHQMTVPEESGGTLAGAEQRAAQSIPVADSGWQYLHGTSAPSAKAGGNDAALPYIITPNPFPLLVAASRVAPGAAQAANPEVPVIGGLSLDTAPFTASAPDGKMMVVWAQGVSQLPSTQASDIYYSYFNGSAFSAPKAIYVDTRADYNPKVVYHKSGKWVALWERVTSTSLKATGDPLADLQKALPLIVPAYSVFDPAKTSWTVPANLMSAGLAKNTILATGPAHDVAAVWIHDSTGNPIPMELNTDTGKIPTSSVRHARFDGTKFSTHTASPVARGVFELDAAINGQELRIATTGMAGIGGGFHPLRDMVNVSIFRQPTAGAFFESVDAVGRDTATSADGLNFAPRIQALGNGQWRTGWVRYEGMERTPQNTLKDVAQTRIAMSDTPTTLGAYMPFVKANANRQYLAPWRATHLDQFKMGQGPQGEAFVAYTEIEGGQQNAVLAYDDPNGEISMPAAILGDKAVEKSVHVGVGPNGSLLVSYLKVGLKETPQVVDVKGMPTAVTKVEPLATGSLSFFTQPIHRDLAIEPVRYAGGALLEGRKITLSADVVSNGFLTAKNVKVSFYAQNQGARAALGPCGRQAPNS